MARESIREDRPEAGARVETDRRLSAPVDGGEDPWMDGRTGGRVAVADGPVDGSGLAGGRKTGGPVERAPWTGTTEEPKGAT